MSTLSATPSKSNFASWETVKGAADALQAEGVTPSVRQVSKRLGGGSPNTITGHLRRWREEKPAIEARKSISIDSRIADILADQISGVVAEATREANAERDARLEDLEEVERRANQLERDQEESLNRIADLEQEGQQMKGQIQSQERELDQTKTDAAEQVRQARADAAEAIKKAEGEAATERAKQDDLTRRLGVAQEQAIEAERLRQALAGMTAEREAQHSARIEAEKGLAVAQARAQEVGNQIETLTERVKGLDQLLSAERVKFGDAQVSAAQARAQAEGNVALIQTLREQLVEMKSNSTNSVEKVQVNQKPVGHVLDVGASEDSSGSSKALRS
jgi:chromosome segregation ATPase